MNDVQQTFLGSNYDEQASNMLGILQLGFRDSVIAVCRQCNRIEEYTLDEAAKRMAARTWPYCHDRRMVMDDPENAPQF